MGHTLYLTQACWDLSPVIGLEGKGGASSGSEENQQHLLRHLPQGRPIKFPQANLG